MIEQSIKLKTFLIEKYGESSSLAKELCDLLNLSKDSIYRRLRGEANFTLDEAVVISRHYRISLDLLMSSESNSFGTYRFRPLYENEDRILENGAALLKLLTYFKSQYGSLTYVAESVPIFKLLHSEVLRNFKVFYWKKVILNYPSHQMQRFNQDYSIKQDYLTILKGIVSHYDSMDISEIWTSSSIQKLLFQIEYSVESGFIPDMDLIEQLYGEVQLFIDDVAFQAQSSKNRESGSYALFECEIELENNCVLAESEEVTNCFLNFNNFNNISIGDEIFTREVKQWISNLKARSVQISGQAEKRRNQFFIGQKAKVQRSFERCQDFMKKQTLAR